MRNWTLVEVRYLPRPVPNQGNIRYNIAKTFGGAIDHGLQT